MAQVADGVLEHSIVDDARRDAECGTLSWFAVPVLLAIGWGTFFGFSAVFLAEDAPVRAHHESALADAAMPAFVMLGQPRRVTPIPDPGQGADAAQAPRPDPLTTEAAAPASASPAPRTDAVAPVPAPATPPVRTAPALERADFIGVWGPTTAACQAPSRRRGYLPATITMTGAKAGRTVCSFKDSRRAGNGWVVAAACSDRGRRWSSQVRLTVDGDRLTWSSGKGAAAYVRCNRRDG